MLGRERIAGLVVAAAFFTLVLAPAVRADTGKPSWSTGDFWEYNVTEPYGTTTLTGTARTEVLGTDSVSIGVDSYASYKVKATVSVTQGSTTITTSTTMWNRQSDLSVVKVESTYTDFNGNTVTTATSFSPPLDLQWPLVAGKTWTAASTVITAPSGSQYAASASFQVQSDQQVTVPAGTFSALPLKVTGATGSSGAYAVLYFSASVGNPVRVQSFDSNNVDTGKAELTKYNYAAGGLGAVLWIIIIFVIVVVVVIAVGLMMRKRKRVPAGMPPAVPGQAWQQQPPPGWQQPQQPWQPPQQPQQPWQPPPQGPP